MKSTALFNLDYLYFFIALVNQVPPYISSIITSFYHPLNFCHYYSFVDWKGISSVFRDFAKWNSGFLYQGYHPS